MPQSARLRPPRLLALVYLGSLALLATTVIGLVVVVNEHVRAATVNATVSDDHAVVSDLMGRTLRLQDLSAPPDATRIGAIDTALSAFLDGHALLGISIQDATGRTWYSAGTARGNPDAASPATEGAVATFSVDESRAVLVEHLPVFGPSGELEARVRLERDAQPILAAAAAATRDVVVVLIAGGTGLALLLIVIFRAAQELLRRRTAQLVESMRRDAVTGLLNHGAVLAQLTQVLEAARPDTGWVVAAAIDIDGFRLLNETHGFDTGDRALRLVAEIVADEAPVGAIVGRAGPDELLVVGPPATAPEVRPAIDRIRARLARTHLPIGNAEPLALTVSVGMASYPEHAASGSELLAVAGLMLAQARTGGGDQVRVDAPELGEPPGTWDAFSVLEGLVVAVGTKDRYTRRHAEQVSEYAVLLAERTGLEPARREQIRIAGVLHDVGKIGVPDVILRKPGPLTDEERAVMEQHTVIGDAVVAGIPGYEEIALGIRHHHERWDGTGYPDRLSGTDIPLIARVIAVGDVYSALTTARPYRRAFSAETAIQMIADGAGSQFDPSLAAAFLEMVDELPGRTLPLDDETDSRPHAADEGTRAA